MRLVTRISIQSAATRLRANRRGPIALSLTLGAVLLLGIACSDQLPTTPKTVAKGLRLNVSVGDGPKIGTDKQDYYLGETVSIEGWEWTPGETVRLQIVHVDELGDNERPEHQPWEVTADADGNVASVWEIALDGDEAGAALKLTADGQISGAHAEVLFTDLDGTVNLFSDAGYTIAQNAFAWNSTVRPRIIGPKKSTCYRIQWTDPSGDIFYGFAETGDPPGATLDLPVRPTGTESGTWNVVVGQRAAGDCENQTSFSSSTNAIYFDVARSVVIGAGTSGETDSPGGDQCVYQTNNITGNNPNTPAVPICQNQAALTMFVRKQANDSIRSYVRFDLAAATPAIPAGATVTDAKVRLVVARTVSSARTYRIQPAGATWTESAITWANQPGVTGTAHDTAMVLDAGLVPGAGGGDPQTWVKWRVAANVQGFLNNPATNFGWRISDVSASTSSSAGRFHTTENNGGCAAGVTAGNCKRMWPVLLIDYTTSVPDSTTVTTAIHKWDPSTDIDSTGVTSVPLGSTVHDKATLANVGGGSGNGTPEGTVAFTFWTDATCGASSGTSSSAGASVAVVAGVAHPSTSQASLAAGSYSFRAAYTSSDLTKWKNSVSPCEPLTVEKATPTLTTTIHQAPHVVVPDSSYLYQGTVVHDSGNLTDLVGGFTPGGTVKYFFYRNNACSGAAADSTAAIAVPGESGAFPAAGQPLVPGQYAYKARYSGDANYNGDTSECEPFRVVPHSLITGGGLCTFDRRSDVTGQQFNAIFTPEIAATTSKLNATNPGQFRFNVFYIPNNGTATIPIQIPAGFVTQGATPVHVYGAVAPTTDNNGVTCFTPSSEISAQKLTVTGAGGGTLNVDVTGSGSSGVIYIVVHVDYYWKNVLAGCTKQPVGTNPTLEHANCTVPSVMTLNSLTNYTFSAFGNTDWNKTVQNFNVFKKDPGIGGLVLRAGTGDPIPNVVVDIYQGNKKVGSVLTDEDGWYMWVFKYTGKATTFTVKLPAYNLTGDYTLKSNGYGIINFNVP